MDSPQHDERVDGVHTPTGGSRKRQRGEDESDDEDEEVRNEGLLDLFGGREGRKRAREETTGFGVLFSTTTTTSPFLPASPPPLTRNGSNSTASTSTPAFELISPRTPALDLYPPSSTALPKSTSNLLDLPEDHNAEFDFETFNAFSWGATEGEGGDSTGLGLGIWSEAEGIGLVIPPEGDGDERRVVDGKQQQQQNSNSHLLLHIDTSTTTYSSESSSSHLLQEPTSNSITTSLTHSLIHHTLRSSSSYPIAQPLPSLPLPTSTSHEPIPDTVVLAQPPHPTTGTFGDYDLDVADEAQLSPFAIGLKRRRETERKFQLRWVG